MVDPVRESLVFRNLKWNASKYYDHPDGKDLFGKLSHTTKIGFFVGAVCGAIKAQQEHPFTLPTKVGLQKTLQVIVPFVGAPIAFTVVTYAATNWRKKDDQLNYVLGGTAAGIVGAGLARVPQYALCAALIFSVFGYFQKSAVMYDTPLFPKVTTNRVRSPYFEKEWNFELVKNRPPSWTSTPPTE